ncbi:MAG: hypothetical protein JNM94_06110 [Phycisphaerae bacterium]|nr:hypothetical protein [Phycisphaerae bacterium]
MRRPTIVLTAFAAAMAIAVGVAIVVPYGQRDPLAAVAVGAPASVLPTPDYVARDAAMDVRLDERKSGLLIKHQLLRLEKVSHGDPLRLRGDTLIYTESPELRRRLDDVLDGRIPLDRGLEATFAVGKLAPATIIRLDQSGRVEKVEDIRAAFVAFTIE